MDEKIIDKYPKVSVVIPTLNAGGVFRDCLSRVREQNYPQDKVEIIVIDGFSSDDTRQIAKSFNGIVIDNPLVVHPEGRSIGIDYATGELILCLDSDNLIVGNDWLQKMVEPFKDIEIFASEPLYYSAEPQDSYITKYCSLIGGDDPIIIYLGYYERFSSLTGKWAEVPMMQEDKGDYLKISFLDNKRIPSLGANGFMARMSVLKKINYKPFFHMDIVCRMLESTHGKFAKVKVGVIHRHSDSFKRFILKKYRRVSRRLDKKSDIQYSYPMNMLKFLKLGLKCLFVFPLFIDSFKANRRSKSRVWALHPLITIAVFYLYFFATLKNKFLSIIGKKTSQNNEYEKV